MLEVGAEGNGEVAIAAIQLQQVLATALGGLNGPG